MRTLILLGGLALAALMLAPPVLGASFFRSVADADARKECGACHMPYPPALMPARSWEKIIGALPNHFGEDASLPEPTRLKILAYMTGNAGDAPKGNAWFMTRVKKADTPARITEMPFWRAIHGGFSPASFKRRGVKKPGNCLGCHG